VKQGEEEDTVVQTDNSGNGTLIRRASYPQGVWRRRRRQQQQAWQRSLAGNWHAS